jgi:hypothetical protein
MSASTKIGLLGALTGPPLTAVWWWLAGVGSWEYFGISTALYAAVTVVTLLGGALPSFKRWMMAIALVLLTSWAAQGVFASIDLTPLLPLLIYLPAVGLAFEERDRMQAV